MTNINWSKKIVKGNSSGAGWITLPAKLRDKVTIGNWYNLRFQLDSSENLELSIKLTTNKACWGFYIPKKVCSHYNLLGKTVIATVQSTDYIKGKISKEKCVRIPKNTVEQYSMQSGDIYKVELKVNGKIFQEIVIIKVTEREDRSNEYYFTIRMQDIPINSEIQMKFTKKIESVFQEKKEHPKTEKLIHLPNLFPEANLGKIAKNKMIIFLGNHKPIIVPINIPIADIIHYFGCYYADGTKVGPGWSTNASTPEQANYFFNIYDSLIFNKKLCFGLTYTKKFSDTRDIIVIKSSLVKYWNSYGIDILPERIRIIQSNSDDIRKSNMYGSLRIRDHRSLVLKIHLRILKCIENYILSTNDRIILWEFLFGIMEGDGYVCGGKKRYGLGIACHEKDKIIRYSLNKLDIIYNVDYSQVNRNISSAIHVNFGLFQVLINLKVISTKVFRYYPKRRNLFIERLLNQSTVKFLMKRKKTLSSFGISFLRNNFSSTKEIIEILKDLEKEICEYSFISKKE